MDTNPYTIDEDLCGIRVVLGLILFEQFHVSLVHELNDGLGRRTNTDVTHERQVLDQTASLSFGCFCGTHKTPMGVVQLARLGDFSVTTDGSIRSSQM